MNSTSWIMVTCPCVINLSLWWDFTVFPTTVTDSSLALRMTPFVLRHYDAFRSPLLVTCFPQIVILNGGKNALWERRETGQWHGVKNLFLWWRLTAFLTTDTDPSHSFRMTFYGLLHHSSKSFAGALNDALPYPVIQSGSKNAVWEWGKITTWHRAKNLLYWWRLNVLYKDHGVGRQK